MWQPLAGWQTFTPVLMYGAHKRLQHEVQSPHTVPSIPPAQLVAPPVGALHVPAVAPGAMVQMPPQQSVPLLQMSPFWMQKDELSAQRPFAQSFEQQSPLAAH